MPEKLPTVYVAGFCFDHRATRLVLIEKKRPAWQAGKRNGVGGKVEPGEPLLSAMIREFEEETGVFVGDWQKFCTLHAKDAIVHLYRAFVTDEQIDCAQTTTDERLVKITTTTAGHFYVCDALPNVRWLIPMALSLDNDGASEFHVTKRYEEEPQESAVEDA